MDDQAFEPTVFDDDGSPETPYMTQSLSQTTDDGWLVTSLDVGTWEPLTIGDRLVALDKLSHDEFVVEVTQVEIGGGELYYHLQHLADLDPSAEPSLDSTRPWLQDP